MDFKESYQRTLKDLLENPAYCEKNRKLWASIFSRWERKLKRMNGLSDLDIRNYKTLCGAVSKFKNVNEWFKGVAWEDITEEQFKQVFNDLEDGKIKRHNGKPFEDRIGYYNKIFRSLPFEMAGKRDIAIKIMEEEFFTPKIDKKVHFITEEEFKKIIDFVIQPRHKLLLWLLWDIGENVGGVLELTKNDCTRRVNLENRSIEYAINLRKDILKRSRTPRTIVSNYQETADLLDLHLSDLQQESKLFDFSIKMAEKVLRRAVRKAKVLCKPDNKHVTLKDLRSSMASHLLRNGWSIDEIKQRMGHKPSSRVLDVYVSYFAIESHKPKEKLNQNKMQELQSKINDMESREKLYIERLQKLMEEVSKIKQSLIA